MSKRAPISGYDVPYDGPHGETLYLVKSWHRGTGASGGWALVTDRSQIHITPWKYGYRAEATEALRDMGFKRRK